MISDTPSIGTAGLSPHEIEVVRLVLECLTSRLHSEWQMREGPDTDVLLADPRTSAGDAAIASHVGGINIILVLDRHDEALVPAHSHLYRPLRPSGLVQVLNESFSSHNGRGVVSGEEATMSRPIREILRNVFQDDSCTSLHLVSGLGSSKVVIDPRRDCIHGPAEQITMALLHSDQVFEHSMVSLTDKDNQVYGVDLPRSPLYGYLWRIALNESDDRVLFGSADTPVRLSRWPRFSEESLTRELFQVATLVRRGPRTVRQLSEMTGVEPARVAGLLNAAWLTCELDVAETHFPSKHESVYHRPVHSSLLARIRERLGTS